MSLADRLREVSDEARWRQEALTMCANGGITAKREIARVLQYVQSRLDKLVGLATDLSDPLDEADLRDAVMYWYIEAKSEWCQFNQRMNYQMMNTGQCDLALMMMGGVGSAILEEVEKLFGTGEIEAVVDFLAAPIARAQELEENRLLRMTVDEQALPQTLFDEIRHTFRVIDNLQFALDGSANSAGLAEFEAAVHLAQTNLRALNDLRLHARRFREKTLRLARDRGFRALLEIDFAENALLTQQMLEGILYVFDTWIPHLIQHGLESSPQERIDRHKSAHVEIKTHLEVDDEVVGFTIEDDGAGLSEAVLERFNNATGGSLTFQTPLPAAPGEEEVFGYGLSGFDPASLGAGTMLQIQSVPGQYTRLCLIMPRPEVLRSREYLHVEAGGKRYAIAGDRVRFLSRIAEGDIQTRATRPTVILHDENHPVVSLVEVLGYGDTGGQDADAEMTAISVDLPFGRGALLVDKVFCFERAICRPLAEATIEVPNTVRGVVKSTDGEMCLVLDEVRLMADGLRSARKRQQVQRRKADVGAVLLQLDDTEERKIA